MKPVKEVPKKRLQGREELLRQVDGALGAWRTIRRRTKWTCFIARRMALVSSPEAQRAFDLSREPLTVRDATAWIIGSDRSIEARKFGGLPHLGQCLLMARRLIEAGVRLVTVCSGRRIDQAWDTHRDHFPLLKLALPDVRPGVLGAAGRPGRGAACSTRLWSW